MASISFQIFITLLALSSIAMQSSAAMGTKFKLMHRDSPLSPLHKRNESTYDRLRNAVQRSIARINHFKSSAIRTEDQSDSDSDPGVVSSGGEYLMRISIGTPPTHLLSIADTGSDLIWVQCYPCEQCFKQDGPLFRPANSSTYREITCMAKPCMWLERELKTCATKMDTCTYSYSYGDESYTRGKLGTEKVAMAGESKSVALQNGIVFGCGTDNAGTFDEAAAGIVGLGGGPLSFVSQMDKSFKKVFSYCLVPFSEESENVTSTIMFGPDPRSNRSKVSTPMVDKEPSTFYYLTLEAISVGAKKIPNTRPWFGGVEKGNIIIDSGTTLTILDAGFYSDIETAVDEAVNLKRQTDPSGTFYMCYSVEKEADLPVITVHFTGADVVLQPANTFIRASDDLLCLSFIPSSDISIFGNMAQANLLVEYDLTQRIVSFSPTKCSSL